MSPWWSRPTADDIPEDYDPTEDNDFELEEDGSEPSAGDDNGASGSGRRRRRRSSRRTSSQDDGAKKDARKKEGPKKPSRKAEEQKASDPGQDERDGAGDEPAGGRRRRRRRASSSAKPDAKPQTEQAKTEQAKTKQAKSDPKDKKPERKSESSGARKDAKKPAGKPAAKRDDRKDDRKDDRRAERSMEHLTFEGSPSEGLELIREIDLSASDRSQAVNDERKIALFCDLENIALGVRDSSEVNKFDILLVLERLLEKGKIIVKKAYCDWERYSDYKRAFHEAAIEMIDIPQKYYSGKNSADIKMVVDAMDLSYSKEHLDTFVVLSGDSDFSPLVSKLKENNKYVIGVGVKNSSSNLLVNNCDEFIYYEDIWRDTQQAPKLDGLDPKTAKAFQLMVDSIQALVRENKDVLWGSMVKQTMQRKKPSFNEGYHGYGSFSELLEDAEKKNIVKLKKDKRSGSYIVTGFA